MDNGSKVYAIVLSGGSGKRFGSGIPKQYLDLNGKPVLAYALQAFENSSVDGVIIIAAAQYIEKCRIIAETGGYSKAEAVIEGGSERYYSVLRGLEYLMSEYEDNEDIIVLIHDGARPLITPEAIDAVTDNVKECGAAIAAAPCTDTIKILDEDGMIVSTTDRRLTWAAQTPQGFRLKDIYSAYKTVFSGGGADCRKTITDDAMVYQLVFPDRKVKAVNPGTNNMKITNASDIDIAARIQNI